ncbi:MAG: uroporphyrinogen-III synthase [Proteobacteria bacterium]|nr:uroporphyrinogen-III synthase [Pseudomonadota bacterium]
MRKRVLVTRASGQAEVFARQLQDAGFEAVIFPVIEFVPPEDSEPLVEAIHNLASFDWLLFTSSNSVAFFITALLREGKTVSDLSGIKICAVGPKTSEATKEAGITIDLVPKKYQAEGVLEAFREVGINDKKILFPRAKEGREILPKGLDRMGAEVNLVPVYRTIKPEGKEKQLEDILKKGFDIISFTSGSTVRNFIEILGEKKQLITGTHIACISDVTAKVAEEYGLEVGILPKNNTTGSMLEAIGDYFTKTF